MKELKRKYLHWKWQRRYNKAKRIAEYKASSYSEDICACHPDFYFKNELDGLKNLTKEYRIKRGDKAKFIIVKED